MDPKAYGYYFLPVFNYIGNIPFSHLFHLASKRRTSAAVTSLSETAPYLVPTTRGQTSPEAFDECDRRERAASTSSKLDLLVKLNTNSAPTAPS